MTLQNRLGCNEVLDAYAALFNDIRRAYPMYKGLEKDFVSLHSCISNKGLPFVLEALPTLDKALLAGLEDGILRPMGPLCKRRSPRDLRPRFMHGLWSMVFEKSLCLSSSVDSTAIYFLRQIFCLFKKMASNTPPHYLTAALEEYYEIERTADEPTLSWVGDHLDPNWIGHSLHVRDGLDVYNPLFPEYGSNRRSACIPSRDRNRLRILLTEFQRNADSVAAQLFGDWEERLDEEIYSRRTTCRHGPGAVADFLGKASKYGFPNWSSKLDRTFPSTQFRQGLGMVTDHEKASRLIVVPKTYKKPRIIAAEPSEHIFIQKGQLHLFIDAIRRTKISWFVDLSNQALSQDLVRKSSLDRSLATADLSSASDRLTCWVIERVFRKVPAFLHSFHASRTRSLSTPHGTLMLKKFATQGTALTFPIQTIVFLICGLTAAGWDGRSETLGRYKGKVRVYGDDIIIPTRGYDDLHLILEYLGLKMNLDKSFHKGYFRESCGLDCYRGDDVTPTKPQVFVGADPVSVKSLVDTSNNLWKKGAWCLSEWFRTRATNSSKLPLRLNVVSITNGAPGWASFVGNRLTQQVRYNRNYQRYEVKTWDLHTRVDRIAITGQESLLQFFIEEPDPTIPWKSGYDSRPIAREGYRWACTGMYM